MKLWQVPPVNKPVRKDWTHVEAADGKTFSGPGLARWYMKQHNIKGAIKFIRG